MKHAVPRFRSGFAVVLVVVLVATGCGGSSDSPTKAEFVKQADAICAATDATQRKGLAAYQQKNPGSGSDEAGQGKAIVEVGLPPIRREVEELAALEAPSGDEEKIEALVAEIEKAIEKSEANPTLLLGAGNPFGRATQLATDYGFKACRSAF